MSKQKFANSISFLAIFLMHANSVFAVNGNGQVVNATSTSDPAYKASVLCNQALNAISKSQWNEAQSSLDEACKFDPNQASCMVHTNLAQVLEHFEKFDEAFKHLKLALEFSPNDQSALVDMGAYYQQIGDVAKATPYFQKYLTLYPDAPDVMTIRQLLTAFKKVKVATVDENATDYLYEASGDKKIRFDKKILNVYFEPAADVVGYQVSYQNALTEAFDLWTQASKVLSWKTISDRSSADIVCKWVDKLLDQNGKLKVESGEAQTASFANVIRSSVIVLSTLPKPGLEVTDSSIKSLCLHEVGHALGLTGHSPHKEDIMFFSNRDSEAPALSPRDKKTIEMLYASDSMVVK
ncbi:MAG: tetratricopeptide repeat protein [Candidatus Obscuribacterales bacterium]|nr:tetratricopeptide repeat protein [Candidatus Obscuribacterales bacterium]